MGSSLIYKLRQKSYSFKTNEDKLQYLKDLYQRKYTVRWLKIEQLSYIFDCEENDIIYGLKLLDLYNKKQCKTCLEWLDYSEFYSSKNIFDSHCISCKNKINNQWHSKNKEYHNQLNMFNSQKLSYKLYYSDYYFEHKDEIRKKANLNQNKRYNNDYSFRLKKRLLNGIYNYLKYNKNDKIVGLLPYTLNDLKIHLEQQFDNNMNWLNYGPYWSIDHIKPISSFNIIDEQCDDFKECWSLNNLRPLSNKENFEKSNKYVAGI